MIEIRFTLGNGCLKISWMFKAPVSSLHCKILHTAGLRVVCICRTFKEGIVPFKPTAYGLHNLLRRNDLLVSRAKVSD